MLYLFPCFVLPSIGFSASFGINHIYPSFETPGMRFSLQSICTRLSEMPHFSAACGADIYSIILPSFLHTVSVQLYSDRRIIASVCMNDFSKIHLLRCRRKQKSLRQCTAEIQRANAAGHRACPSVLPQTVCHAGSTERTGRKGWKALLRQ